MKEIIDVNTGQVELGTGKVVLRSLAIGSCIAVAAYDRQARIGAMAHIMLPGRAPQDCSEPNRYAEDAVEEMIGVMVAAHSRRGNIEVCLVGAGNVLQELDDTICNANIRSTVHALERRNIPIRARLLGGTDSKSISLDVESGDVSYREGDGRERLLWKPATA